MGRSAASAYQPWIKLAEKQGWTITTTGSGHLRWRAPCGSVVHTAHTPGRGNRSMKNARADLRKLGLVLP